MKQNITWKLNLKHGNLEYWGYLQHPHPIIQNGNISSCITSSRGFPQPNIRSFTRKTTIFNLIFFFKIKIYFSESGFKRKIGFNYLTVRGKRQNLKISWVLLAIELNHKRLEKRWNGTNEKREEAWVTCPWERENDWPMIWEIWWMMRCLFPRSTIMVGRS